jgi:hypothetical protein
VILGIKSDVIHLDSFSRGVPNSADLLSGPPVVVIQHPAEPFSALDASSHVDFASLIVDQPIVDSLVIPLDVVVLHVLSHGVPQMSLSERNDPRQTFGLDGAHESFRMGSNPLSRRILLIVFRPIS